MSTKLPPDWAELAEKAGIRATMNGIAQEAGVSTSALSRLIRGEGESSAQTIRAVAKVLRVEMADLFALAGLPAHELGWWDPPTQAHQMDADERDAVARLIRVMTRGGDRSDSGQDEAQKSPPPDTLGDDYDDEEPGEVNGNKSPYHRRHSG